MKRNGMIIVGLCVALLLSACSGKKAADAPAQGGAAEPAKEAAADPGEKVEKKMGRDTLIVALEAEPQKLDPHTQNLPQSYNVMQMVEEPLIKKGKDGEYEPCLAESWEMPDETTIIFHLRDNVYFHNGEKFTSEDVIYTINRAKTGSATKTQFSDIDEANTKAIDELTVEMKLHQPSSAVLNYLSMGRGYILNKKAMEEMGEDAYGRAPVGTGPYMFTEWVSGDHIKVTKNDSYWGENPGMENVTYRFISDSSVRSIELESGGVDIIYTVGPEDYARLDENPHIVALSGPGYTHEILQMSMEAEEFSDIRIREAMNIALDTTAIVKAVYGDLAMAADSVISSEVFAHKAVGPIKQDIERAKQLVIEAGYPNGFECEITVPDDRQTLNMLEIAQAMWKEAGINVTITTYDLATIRERNVAKLTRFGRTRFFAGSGDPDHAMSIWAIGYAGGLNCNDPHIQELLDAGRAEYDNQKRKEIYGELQEYCWNTYYSVPMAFPYISYAHGDYVKGFEFVPSGLPDLTKVTVE